MKTRLTLAMILLLVGFNVRVSQAQSEECGAKLSIFHEYVKADNFDSAYEPWMWVRTNNCPKDKYYIAVIADGEKILKYKIENSSGAEQVGFINDLLKLYDEAATDYSFKYSKGETLVDKAQTQYKYKDELKLSDLQLYNAYDNAYKNGKKDFTNPSALYTYFSLMVDLFDAGKKPAQELFDKYDDVMEKIEEETQNASEKLNKYLEKEESGQPLTSKEAKYKKYYEQILEAYDKVSGSIDAKLGQRANCEVLIPLYQKDFESKKNDAVWLKRAVNRMYNKECTEDPLYIELVKAYDQTAPSADTKVFVAGLLLKDGKTNEALEYFREAYGLQTDPYKKGLLAEKIAGALKNKGRYSEARNYYTEALKLNPSNGRPHLAIAIMYANSANDCGDTVFNKRAVYWLAEAEARKATSDPKLAKHAAQSAASYQAKAPSKSDIFSLGNSGQKINIGCWIGRTVTVPKI